MRRAALAVACLTLAGARPLRAQAEPRLEVTLRDASGAGPPEVLVSIRGLLNDDRFVAAMRSGFPLYVAYQVEFRESRPLWDRTVDRTVAEYVASYDPVREQFVVEDGAGTEILRARAALERRFEQVVVMPGFQADQPGRYHYRATVTARTLSDEDVDEVYAWLNGEDAETARRHRPGVVTRAARKLLVQVASLPSLTLEARTATFSARP